ncbi:MAG: FtsX-like permease family protein [Pseudomonadota bacterium]
MHALGASPRMVLALFLGDGFVLGTVGWLMALPLGGFMTRAMLTGVSDTISTLFVRVQVDRLHLSGTEILLNYVINPQSFGWSFVYRVDWSALMVSVPLVAAVALMAAIPALRTVFRTPPATLLREL